MTETELKVMKLRLKDAEKKIEALEKALGLLLDQVHLARNLAKLNEWYEESDMGWYP